jgi:hypothetical protein
MLRPSLAVAVVMERTPIQSRWESQKWETLGVIPDRDPPGAPPRLLIENPERAQWLHPGFKLELFADEAEGYYLNLSSPQPFVFVNWNDEDGHAVPIIVTVSYNEAARLMDAGGRVDGVPMAAEWRPWLAGFVGKHYRPEPKKRARPASFKGARRDDR